jgi:N-ethylmaleimide reductase
VTLAPTLFDPVRLGDIECANRVMMAPMTRSRANEQDCPTQLHVDYYQQRASAGLIVTEGTQPSVHGKGYPRTPGIHDDAQIESWRAVADAIHAAGGRIVLQLMHVGRIASRHNKKPEARTVAPSAVRANVKMYTDAAGVVEVDVPRALSLAEVASVIEEYAQAARNARQAGFDGVELHASSGYLPMQFLASNSNLRTDAYGGSARNRARFAIEVLEAMAGAIGAGRVGLRVGMGNPFNDVVDPNPAQTYGELLAGIRTLGLAYLHVVRGDSWGIDGLALARKCFAGPLIANDGFDLASASRALADGVADAVSFARHFISNPDLVLRLREQLPLAPFDRKTLYTPGPRGYVDYPPADRPQLAGTRS